MIPLILEFEYFENKNIKKTSTSEVFFDQVLRSKFLKELFHFVFIEIKKRMYLRYQGRF